MSLVCGRPLVFGDREQVEHLRKAGFYKPVDDTLKKFRVRICASGEVSYVVTAPDKEEAKELAHEAIDFDAMCDIDTTVKELAADSLDKVDIEYEEAQ